MAGGRRKRGNRGGITEERKYRGKKEWKRTSRGNKREEPARNQMAQLLGI